MSKFESQFVKRYGKRPTEDNPNPLYVEMRENVFMKDYWVYSSERAAPIFTKDEAEANQIFSYLHKAIKVKIGEKW